MPPLNGLTRRQESIKPAEICCARAQPTTQTPTPRAVLERYPSPAQHISLRNMDGDMSRATYPHVAGFPDLRVIRPAPTAARPPKPFPGFAGYRPGIASLAPQAIGVETALPGSHDDRSHVQRPIRRRVPQRPLLDQERLPWPSPCLHRLGTLSSPPEGGLFDDAYSGFTHVADRAIAPPRFAPDLSITHGGTATRDPGISPDRTHTGRPS
jgi:hypothetical protein